MLLLREAVSKEKRRYKEDGFDLDLSYMGVNDRIVAMGFPSESMEAAYRNPMKDVLKLLDTKHKDHYKVYNLCSERGYDAEKFYNRVGKYPFDDHNCPPFEMITEFCEDVQNWLNQDDQNIAVIHCKAGKGRTGLMICAWLLYSRMWPNPEQALSYYASMRTHNQKGVTIPSQLRYVRYFHESLYSGVAYVPRPLLLTKIIFHTLPKTGNINDIDFSVHVGKTQAMVFSYKQYVEGSKLKDVPKVHRVDKKKKKEKKNKDKEKGGEKNLSPVIEKPQYENGNKEKEGESEKKEGEEIEETAEFDCGANGVPVCGDIKMDFERKGERIFAFWFNTFFIKDLHVIIDKKGLDKAHKDCKNNKLYEENFTVELIFSEMAQNSSTRTLTTANSSPSITSGVANININNNNNNNNIDSNNDGTPSSPSSSSLSTSKSESVISTSSK